MHPFNSYPIYVQGSLNINIPPTKKRNFLNIGEKSSPTIVALQVYTPALSGTTDVMVIAPSFEVKTLDDGVCVISTMGIGYPSGRQSSIPVAPTFEEQFT